MVCVNFVFETFNIFSWQNFVAMLLNRQSESDMFVYVWGYFTVSAEDSGNLPRLVI